MDFDQNDKYKVGDTVYAKVDPDVKLIVRKHYANIYYCRFVDLPMKKELALFEREIVNNLSQNAELSKESVLLESTKSN